MMHAEKESPGRGSRLGEGVDTGAVGMIGGERAGDVLEKEGLEG